MCWDVCTIYGPSIYVDRLISPDFLSRLEINCASLKVHLILSAAAASLRFMAKHKLQRGKGNEQRATATCNGNNNVQQLAACFDCGKLRLQIDEHN